MMALFLFFFTLVYPPPYFLLPVLALLFPSPLSRFSTSLSCSFSFLPLLLFSSRFLFLSPHFSFFPFHLIVPLVSQLFIFTLFTLLLRLLFRYCAIFRGSKKLISRFLSPFRFILLLSISLRNLLCMSFLCL